MFKFVAYVQLAFGFKWLIRKSYFIRLHSSAMLAGGIYIYIYIYIAFVCAVQLLNKASTADI